MMTHNKRVHLSLLIQTRTINVEGRLIGTRVVRQPTKLHSGPNQWYETLKSNLRNLGFKVDDVEPLPEVSEPPDATADEVAHALCHGIDSGLESAPEDAQRVAAWLLHRYRLVARGDAS